MFRHLIGTEDSPDSHKFLLSDKMKSKNVLFLFRKFMIIWLFSNFFQGRKKCFKLQKEWRESSPAKKWKYISSSVDCNLLQPKTFLEMCWRIFFYSLQEFWPWCYFLQQKYWFKWNECFFIIIILYSYSVDYYEEKTQKFINWYIFYNHKSALMKMIIYKILTINYE